MQGRIFFWNIKTTGFSNQRNGWWQEYDSLLYSAILFAYGILYQATETAVACYLGR